MNAPLPENEPKRIEALERLGIMDTPPESSFDELAWLAAHSCGSRYAQINFVHTSRVWAKANVGFPETEQRRHLAIDAFVVSAEDIVVIPDTYEDERTKLNPLVIQGPRVRFFAGVPLFTQGHEAVGTLCVMDTDPHPMTVAQGGALWALSRQVMANLLNRRAPTGEHHLADVDAEERARRHAERVSALADQMPAILWTTDEQLRFTTTLGAAGEIFHMKPADVVGRTLQEYFGTDDETFPPIAAHLAVLRGEDPGALRWSGWGRTLEVRITPLHGKDGVLAGCLGMGLDITERAELDETADRMRDDLRALMTAAARAVPVDGKRVERSPEARSGGASTGGVARLLEGIHRQSA